MHEISTHAPAGGATRCKWEGVMNIRISTHAPAGGATGCFPGGVRFHDHFYSRPCGRGDVFLFSVGYRKLSISTHAPAGGATLRVRMMPTIRVFLLTPLREGRPRRLFSSANTSSISTHAPAGGATCFCDSYYTSPVSFLLTPLREGRRQFSTSPS